MGISANAGWYNRRMSIDKNGRLSPAKPPAPGTSSEHPVQGGHKARPYMLAARTYWVAALIGCLVLAQIACQAVTRRLPLPGGTPSASGSPGSDLPPAPTLEFPSYPGDGTAAVPGTSVTPQVSETLGITVTPGVASTFGVTITPDLTATQVFSAALEITPTPLTPPPGVGNGPACFANNWLYGGPGGLTCLTEAGWQTYNAKNSSLPDNLIADLEFCPDGSLLIASLSGVTRLVWGEGGTTDASSWKTYKHEKMALGADRVACWSETMDEGDPSGEEDSPGRPNVWRGFWATTFDTVYSFDSRVQDSETENSGVWRLFSIHQVALKANLIRDVAMAQVPGTLEAPGTPAPAASAAAGTGTLTPATPTPAASTLVPGNLHARVTSTPAAPATAASAPAASTPPGTGTLPPATPTPAASATAASAAAEPTAPSQGERHAPPAAWVITDSSVAYYNEESGQWTVFDAPGEGLPEPNPAAQHFPFDPGDVQRRYFFDSLAVGGAQSTQGGPGAAWVGYSAGATNGFAAFRAAPAFPAEASLLPQATSTPDANFTPSAIFTATATLIPGSWERVTNRELIRVASLASWNNDPGQAARLALGSSINGVFTYDAGGWTHYNLAKVGLASNKINAIAIDARWRVWAATGWGLVVFDPSAPDGQQWIAYHMHSASLEDNYLGALAVYQGGPSLPPLLQRAGGSISGVILASSAPEPAPQGTQTPAGPAPQGTPQPLANALVEICVEPLSASFLGDSPCAGQPFLRQFQTAENGSFLFTGLPAGYYVLTVQTTDGGWAQLSAAPGSGAAAASERILVGAGQAVDLGVMLVAP